MKITKYIAIAFTLLTISGCDGLSNDKNSVRLSEREAHRYDKALQAIEKVE